MGSAFACRFSASSTATKTNAENVRLARASNKAPDEILKTGDLGAKGVMEKNTRHTEIEFSDALAALMAEPPEGVVIDHKLDFLSGGGWVPRDIKDNTMDGEAGGGITHHRGVLHKDEYVDDEALLRRVEVRLGFSKAQVLSVYRQGRLSANQIALRDRLDARLLELSRHGGNMSWVCRILGLQTKRNGNCNALDTALARAKKAEARA